MFDVLPNQDWVTSAETCEAVLAYLAVDETERWLTVCSSGLSATVTTTAPTSPAWSFPNEVNFPGGERSAYTAAAIVLAADALSGASPASRLLWAYDALPEVEPVSIH